MDPNSVRPGNHSSSENGSVASVHSGPPDSIREDPDSGPDSGPDSDHDDHEEEAEEVEVEEYEGIRHPSRIANIHNLRLASGNSVAPDAKTTLRITMMAEPRRFDDFMFDPIEFDLVEDEPSIRFARIPADRRRAGEAVVQEPRRILFNTMTITRGSHAQIWCEGGQVNFT
jgi:hypothetical protein